MYTDCNCSDRWCHAHRGTSACAGRGNTILYRVDMNDLTGTVFCDDCASDALDSGLFTDEPPFDEDALDEYAPQSCGTCGGVGFPLGSLGLRHHYRCEDCGIEFSK
jgi:hypothetical protein